MAFGPWIVGQCEPYGDGSRGPEGLRHLFGPATGRVRRAEDLGVFATHRHKARADSFRDLDRASPKRVVGRFIGHDGIRRKYREARPAERPFGKNKIPLQLVVKRATDHDFERCGRAESCVRPVHRGLPFAVGALGTGGLPRSGLPHRLTSWSWSHAQAR